MIITGIHVKDILLPSLELWGAIFSFIAALLMLLYNGKTSKDFRYLSFTLIANAALLLSEAMTFVCDGFDFSYSYWLTRIVYFLNYALIPVMLWFITLYIVTLLGPKAGRPVLITTSLMCIITLVLLSISQYTHWYYTFDSRNRYQRESIFWIHTLIMVAFMLIVFVFIILRRKQVSVPRFISLLSFGLLSLPASAAQIWIKGYSLTYIAFTIGLMIIITAALYDKSREIASEQRRMQELSTRLVVSQIKPHFVYNSLNTIYYLIKKDPDLARSTLAEFSEYMRGNSLALSREEPVPFIHEIEHVKRYLSLEQKRFGDKLTVAFDLQAEDFHIPALSVQPLVENAVKHGLGKKPEGGTIKISSRQDKNNYIIEIKDDGVGFDLTDPTLQDSKEHLGIANVSTRIETMSSGTLDITSCPGKGTTAVITIPRSRRA